MPKRLGSDEVNPDFARVRLLLCDIARQPRPNIRTPPDALPLSHIHERNCRRHYAFNYPAIWPDTAQLWLLDSIADLIENASSQTRGLSPFPGIGCFG